LPAMGCAAAATPGAAFHLRYIVVRAAAIAGKPRSYRDGVILLAVAIKYLAHRGKQATGKGRTTMSHAVRAFSGDST